MTGTESTGGKGRSFDARVLGLPGSGSLPARWQHVEPLFTELNTAYGSGGPIAAEPVTRRILAATDVADVDAVGLDLRGRALSNLSAIAEARGDAPASIDFATRAIAACTAAEAAIGSARRTPEVRFGAVINRAQTLALVGRSTEALQDLEALGAEFDHATPPLLIFGRHNTLGGILLDRERFADAEVAFRTALSTALAHEPRLASYAYSGLAALAHRTGDPRLAAEQLQISRQLQATGPIAAARTEENLARLLLDRGEVDAAEERFLAAEEGYRHGGDPRSAAVSRLGRAAVLLARGKLAAARRLVEQVRAEVLAQGDVWAQFQAELLLGDTLVAQWRFPAADAAYRRARAVCASTGALHEAARVDVRRAVAALTAAERSLFPAEKQRMRRAALDLALPAALATDALRGRFAAGPMRERWIRTVSTVAFEVALQSISALAETRLAVEVIEFLCSSPSLDAFAPSSSASERAPENDHVRFAVLEAPYALAASGEAGTVSPSAAGGGAPPPFVRALPGDESFRVWIAESERRYGVAIRSAEAVDAW